MQKREVIVGETEQIPTIADLLLLSETVPMLNVNLNNYKWHDNPLLECGGKGSWDELGIERAVIIRIGKEDWRMWYGGFDINGAISIGLAVSKNGIQWIKYPDNPVFEPSEEWEGKHISPTSVVFAKGSFYLYYWGPGHLTPDRIKKIGLAVSQDGIHWTKKGIVLDAEPEILNESPASGGTGVDAAKVFYHREENRWSMIFTAFGPHGIWNGLAESIDGINWKKIKAPLVPADGLHDQFNNKWGNDGYTLRCQVQMGNIWSALGVRITDGLIMPAVAKSLDQWLVFGRPILYSNQDYEGPQIAPIYIADAGDWFYIYYVQLCHSVDVSRPNTLNLVRAPKLSKRQPMVLWEQKVVPSEGSQTMVIEPHSPKITLYLESDCDGTLVAKVSNPVTNKWIELHSVKVSAGQLVAHSYPHSPAKLRWWFQPASGKSQAIVSSWVICE